MLARIREGVERAVRDRGQSAEAGGGKKDSQLARRGEGQGLSWWGRDSFAPTIAAQFREDGLENLRERKFSPRNQACP